MHSKIQWKCHTVIFSNLKCLHCCQPSYPVINNCCCQFNVNFHWSSQTEDIMTCELRTCKRQTDSWWTCVLFIQLRNHSQCDYYACNILLLLFNLYMIVLSMLMMTLLIGWCSDDAIVDHLIMLMTIHYWWQCTTDDNVLLAPSTKGWQRLLDALYSYGCANDILFNKVSCVFWYEENVQDICNYEQHYSEYWIQRYS